MPTFRVEATAFIRADTLEEASRQVTDALCNCSLDPRFSVRVTASGSERTGAGPSTKRVSAPSPRQADSKDLSP